MLNYQRVPRRNQLLVYQVVRFFDIMDEAKVGRVGFTEFHNFVEAAVQVEPRASHTIPAGVELHVEFQFVTKELEKQGR